jgi:antitoxin component YwqK of YwqJK toxin-antitoxin module
VIALAGVFLLLAGAIDCPPGAERRGEAPPDGHEQWCEVRDLHGKPRRHGPARTWYDDGTPWVEEGWRDGEREGPFLERYRNGRLAREGAYRAGRRHGRFTTWHENGNRAEEIGFRDGVPDGPFASFFESGRPRTEGRHCGGAQCGRWRTFDESGRELGAVDYGEQRPVP